MYELKTDVISLKNIMVEKGYKNVKELSKKSGINNSLLEKILDGEIQPSTFIMCKLVVALEIDPNIASNIFFSPDLRNK